MNNEEILTRKYSLKEVLLADYYLTEEEANSVLEKIDFAYPFVIEHVDNPKKFEFHTTLEYVQDNIYVSPSELRNSYYGISRDPSIGIGEYIKVAMQEKEEEIYIIRDQETHFMPGKINIIEDKKEHVSSPVFDPEKQYIAVKKVTHTVTSLGVNKYYAYVVLIYTPNKKKVKKFKKIKDTLKKFV